MEADFLRYYGLDLRNALWGADRIGMRRLRALVSNLPADAAVFLHYQPEDQPEAQTEAKAEGNGHVVTGVAELKSLVAEWNGG